MILIVYFISILIVTYRIKIIVGTHVKNSSTPLVVFVTFDKATANPLQQHSRTTHLKTAITDGRMSALFFLFSDFRCFHRVKKIASSRIPIESSSGRTAKSAKTGVIDGDYGDRSGAAKKIVKKRTPTLLRRPLDHRLHANAMPVTRDRHSGGGGFRVVNFHNN